MEVGVIFAAFCLGWSLDTFVELNASPPALDSESASDSTLVQVKLAPSGPPLAASTAESQAVAGGATIGSTTTGRASGQEASTGSGAGSLRGGNGLVGDSVTGNASVKDTLSVKDTDGSSPGTGTATGGVPFASPWSEEDHQATWPPGFPQTLPKDPRIHMAPTRGCVTTDSMGEGCYFLDAMVCVGLHSESLVGVVVEEGDELLAHPELVDRRVPGFEASGETSLPSGFVSGLRSAPRPYIGTNPAKRWGRGLDRTNPHAVVRAQLPSP